MNLIPGIQNSLVEPSVFQRNELLAELVALFEVSTRSLVRSRVSDQRKLECGTNENAVACHFNLTQNLPSIVEIVHARGEVDILLFFGGHELPICFAADSDRHYAHLNYPPSIAFRT